MGDQYAHSWAIHEPDARDGSGIMPHMHLMFSPRRQDDEQDRDMRHWFAQVNHGGVPVERTWRTKGRLYAVRETVALLSNAALAREGLDVAIDHRSLEAQGFSRDPARYEAGDEAGEKRTTQYRQRLKDRGVTAFERWVTHLLWQDQASTLPSLDRETVRELARDRIWGEAPTMADLMADLAREPTEQVRVPTREPTQAPELIQTQAEQAPAWTSIEEQLADLAARLDRLGDEESGSGRGRVRLWDDDAQRRERERGMSW
jgi:hypothetical protein